MSFRRPHAPLMKLAFHVMQATLLEHLAGYRHEKETASVCSREPLVTCNRCFGGGALCECICVVLALLPHSL